MITLREQAMDNMQSETVVLNTAGQIEILRRDIAHKQAILEELDRAQSALRCPNCEHVTVYQRCELCQTTVRH